MLILTIHALTFAVGLPANVFTFLTLLAKFRCHRPHPRLTAADLLLLHLTTADLLVLLFLPFKMAEAAAKMAWPFPIALCPIANFCFFSSIYLSTLFMAALSVERYFGVIFPHRYNRRRRLWRTMAASAVLWVVALSHCSFIFVAEYHREFVVNGSRGYGEGGFGVNGIETGGSGMSNPNGVDPTGLKMDSSRCFGFNGFCMGGFGLSKPNGIDMDVLNNSTGDVTISRGLMSPGVDIYRISSPETDLNISTLTFSACTTPNTTHIPITTLRTSQKASVTQPHPVFHCYDDFSQTQLSFVLRLRLELFFVLFLLPFAITVFCYVRLIRALLTRPHIPLQKKYRTVGLAVATMVNFGVCFAPYNLSHVVGFVQQRNPEWRPYALILTTLSAALDPFIFYFSSSAVRRAVSGVVGAVRGKMCGFWGWCRQRE
ncbi:free fatty acid receptor 3-like [Numida meleagris]|uniref:free fatty acid receptor 3-like n=1 Tax=Numida meleagris TaxID=8996 RepID=UPI000B3E1305|nr:free fatty acid receptor 3-like [Numida meleagris]